MKRSAVVIALFLLPILWAAGEDVSIEQITRPDFPGAYRHPASITQLDNGDLLVAYYGGSGEYGTDTAVYGTRLKAGQKRWSDPVVLADTPDRAEGNPVVWQAPDGIVWLFYVNRYGDTWSTSRIKAKISKDGAKTWSDSFMFAFELGSMARSQPIVLNDGDYLLPVYYETGHDTEMTGRDSCSYFFRYNPKEKTWKETNRIHSPTGNIQAQVAQISDKHLICYLRRGGNYEPTTTGYLLRAESFDGGWTWTDAKDTEFPNPNSAVDFIKLKNGHLLLVYNDNMNDRTPLRVAISTDNAETFPCQRNICTGNNSFAYPYAIQTRDGKIHIVYTTNQRVDIMHAVFDEEAILKYPVK
ncbi:MAG TPA: exo-alpha-sialidase [bacterium]|nr:exo-alpha-sialidase [bacterium]HQL61895.1 exo-alpha-sialidase [bacterium]